jgi:Holliday junction resolvase RusA-like endonuclease
MMQINFAVYGEPVPKGRPRFSTRGKFPVAYTPEKTKNYESEVAMMAKAAMGASEPLNGALEAFIYVTFSVPASYSKKRIVACLSNSEKHTKKPDLDNVIKCVIDGMDKIVFLNDSQITSIHSTKVYGEIPKVEVLVREAA